MLTFFQAIMLGLMQGIAELFPISSLGHTVIVPSVLHWSLDQTQPEFVSFVVLTHLATALVLLGFFWSDWVKIIKGVFHSLAIREISDTNTYDKLAWLIVVTTLPVGTLGLVFEKYFTKLFADPKLVAAALLANGLVLFVAEQMRTRAPEGKADDTKLAALTWKQAIYIGCAQCFALIPGFSRTGLAMTGSLMNGLSHENAARYAFLLATPVILAAALLKVPELFTTGSFVLGQALSGAVAAGIAAYFSVRFLTKYFETKTLTPFAYYCVGAGIIFLLLL